MKKILCSIMLIMISALLCLTFVSCSVNTDKPEENVSESFTLSDILDKINNSVEMSGDMMTLSADDLVDYYGIESTDVASCAVSQDMCGYLDEIIMIEAADESSVANIETALNDYLEYKKEEMKSYLPEQYNVLTKCNVNVDGLYVSLFISASAGEINEIYNGYVK